jgi:hypothetical protein
MGPRRPVNGRHLGTRPRRTPGPFTAVDMPALRACCATAQGEPHGGMCSWDPPDPIPLLDPAEGVPIARPFAPRPTWGEACVLDVDEAERLAEVFLP